MGLSRWGRSQRHRDPAQHMAGGQRWHRPLPGPLQWPRLLFPELLQGDRPPGHVHQVSAAGEKGLELPLLCPRTRVGTEELPRGGCRGSGAGAHPRSCSQVPVQAEGPAHQLRELHGGRLHAAAARTAAQGGHRGRGAAGPPGLGVTGSAAPCSGRTRRARRRCRARTGPRWALSASSRKRFTTRSFATSTRAR